MPHNQEEAPGGEGARDIDPDQTAEMLDQINRELTDAVRERDDAMEKWKRALADFQNYQRRALLNEQEAKRQGVTSVLMSVLPILDHFEQALAPEAMRGSPEQFAAGVAAIQSELLRALGAHGVNPIAPGAGDEFDPHLHQAISQQPAPPATADSRVQPGQVISTLQTGYALGDRVVRPAKVVVAAPPQQ